MRRVLLYLALLFLAALAAPLPAADQIPDSAQRYRRMLIQAAQAEFGLAAPLSLLAGQIHQESAWRPEARSKFASGLAQFTPDTASWIARRYPSLGSANPLSPKWALAAQSRYNRHLYEGVLGASSECDRWAFVLSGYNGGPGWVLRDRSLAGLNGADSARWWGHAEFHSRRAAWAFIENRGYVKKIVYRWQPLYYGQGWGGLFICHEGLSK